MSKSAVFVDLDRTLLSRASGQVLNKALMDEGVLPQGRSLPGDRLLYAVNNRLGENLLSMGLVRAAARVAKGWRQDQVQAAGKRAVPELLEKVGQLPPPAHARVDVPAARSPRTCACDPVRSRTPGPTLIQSP